MPSLALAALLATAIFQDASRAPSRDRIESDLVLRVGWKGDAPRHRWWPASPKVELVNRSEAMVHRVVRPGDGSGVRGRREPYVYVTVERQAEDGAWTAVRRPIGVGCGIYDADWTKDVVDLAPGESIEVSWIWFSPGFLADDRPHRLFVHYEFRREPVNGHSSARGRPVPVGSLGRMSAWPAFHIVSEPLEVRFEPDAATPEEMTQALRLHLAVEPTASPPRWDDLRVSVDIRNVSSERSFAFVASRASELAVPWRSYPPEGEPEATLEVERRLEDGRWQSIHSEQPHPFLSNREWDWRLRVRSLEPGATAALSPPRPISPGDLGAESSRPVVRLRARYSYRAKLVQSPREGVLRDHPAALGAMSDVPPFTLRSDWVEIELAAEDRR